MAVPDDFEVALRWAEGADEPELQVALDRLGGPQRALAERLVELGRRRRDFARQLSQTAKLAEIGLAMAELVHDMRQPLSAISGFAQLLQDHPADPEAQGWVGEIRGQSTRLEQMIERLRRFVRSPDEPAPASTVDAAEVAREAVAFFHKLPPGVGLELEIAEGPLPLARAEHGALLQVLFNLLANARDALQGCERGRILLRVQALPDSVRALVADDGVGIAPAVRGRLFEPFATSKGEAGTGLGLYICRELVASWGGSVRLFDPAPAPFRTAFAVDLPRASPPAARPRGNGAAAPLPLAQLADEVRQALVRARPARRVIVVDDQAPMRRALRVLLADEPGLQVEESADGSAAAGLLAKGPALLLLERSLPGMSGLDLLRWARAHDLGLEAIFVTGQPTLQSALDALELGAADYLCKPVEPAGHLRARVREALARQRRRLLLRALDSEARVWAERALSMRGDAQPQGALRAALERLSLRPEGPGRFLVVRDAAAAEQVALAGHRAEGPVDLVRAQASLADGRCDAVLLGADAPHDKALELAGRARALAWPVPVVWGAPLGHFAEAVQAIRAGAAALVTRPLDPRTFGPTLTRIVRSHREETRALALERALGELRVVWD